MDWQDILSLVVFLLLVAFPKKPKPAKQKEASSDEPNVDVVRKKIEALKRQRSKTPTEPVLHSEIPVKKQPVFSAYTHLIEPEKIETIENSEKPQQTSVDVYANVAIKSIDRPRKRIRLQNWVVGQVVLGTPAYRRYGDLTRC